MSLAVLPLSLVPGLSGLVTSTGEGPDYQVIRRQWAQAKAHFEFPITRETIEQQFRGFVETWRLDRGPSSSMAELIMHPAYQRIIGMGRAVVPLLLAELVQRPDHWFWALYAITGANPVKPEHAGNLREMASDWLEWGREQDFIL